MIKTLLKYVKKRWWVFLIYIPVICFSIFATCVLWIGLGIDDAKGQPVISSGVLLVIIGYLVFVFCMLLPTPIITIPAARKFGKEKKESSFKYFWIYQGILTATLFVLIFPFFLILLFLP